MNQLLEQDRYLHNQTVRELNRAIENLSHIKEGLKAELQDKASEVQSLRSHITNLIDEVQTLKDQNYELMLRIEGGSYMSPDPTIKRLSLMQTSQVKRLNLKSAALEAQRIITGLKRELRDTKE